MQPAALKRFARASGDVGDGGRQREHEVIIGNRQEFGFPLGEPRSGRRALTPWAMAVATRVVRDGLVGAVLAARDMAAERCRAAVLDRRQRLQLAEAHMAGVGLTPSLAMPRKISATSRARR